MEALVTPLPVARSTNALTLNIADRDRLLRQLTIAFLLAHFAAAVAAALSLVMLHGDGSWFVYALTLDEPWALKWRAIAARASVYVLTVAPTEILANLLHLGPVATAQLNGFVFYGVPGLLYGLATRLVWHDRPDLLYFLILQSLCAFGLCFGFPSEILIAPGFLWIALFLVAKRGITLPFFVAYTALVFCHELALPAVLVVAYFAWGRAREERPRSAVARIMVVWALALPIMLMLLVRQAGGGEGSDSNAIFVIDPRRVLNNPTLWIIAALCPPMLFARRSLGTRAAQTALWIAGLSAFVLCLLASQLIPSLNFADGRYDGRTLIALSMIVLSIFYVREELKHRHQPEARSYRQHPRGISAERMNVAVAPLGAACGIVLASTMLFLSDWMVATRGLRQVVTRASQGQHSTDFIPMEHALGLMTVDEAVANRRMGFAWVYPYRSFVLANGMVPDRIVIGDGNYKGFCAMANELKLGHGPYPRQTFKRWVYFSCHHVAPRKPDTRSKHLMRRLRSLLS
jgi:hypothetical protein